MPDQLLGLQGQVSVGEDDVVGVGDAGVGGETEGGEDGLAATGVAGEGIGPVETHGPIDFSIAETIRQLEVLSEKKMNFS